MSTQKRQKRIAEISDAYDESRIQESIEQVIISQTNDALFIIDTNGKKKLNKSKLIKFYSG